MWPWTSYLTSLNLSFLISKEGGSNTQLTNVCKDERRRNLQSLVHRKHIASHLDMSHELRKAHLPIPPPMSLPYSKIQLKCFWISHQFGTPSPPFLVTEVDNLYVSLSAYFSDILMHFTNPYYMVQLSKREALSIRYLIWSLQQPPSPPWEHKPLLFSFFDRWASRGLERSSG